MNQELLNLTLQGNNNNNNSIIVKSKNIHGKHVKKKNCLDTHQNHQFSKCCQWQHGKFYEQDHN